MSYMLDFDHTEPLKPTDKAQRTLYQMLRKEGYCGLRQTATGEWVGVHAMLYTYGLFVGLTRYGYARRYCYVSLHDAVASCRVYQQGDPQGLWIKVKGEGGERLGPGATAMEGDHDD